MAKKPKIYKSTSDYYSIGRAQPGDIRNTVDKNNPKSGKFQKGNQMQKRKIGMKYNVIDDVLDTAKDARVKPHRHLQKMLEQHASGEKVLTDEYEFKVSKALTDLNMKAEEIKRNSAIEAAAVIDDEQLDSQLLEFLGINPDEVTE